MSYTCVQHTVPCSHIRHYARSTAGSQEDDLHLAVKQYKPRYEPTDGDVTILAAHANAFPKELYEPIWEDLFLNAENREPGHRIRAIWIADVANEGQSGIMNEGKIGNDPSCHDHARDYLNLVNHFRQDMIRPIVGFGHSLGGNVIISLALLHPRRLTSIVAIEPILCKSVLGQDYIATYFLTMKKDKWPSRDAAMESITKSPFYAHWDQKVLNIYREQAGSKDTVTLTTTKHQEVLSFSRQAFPRTREQPLSEFIPDRNTHAALGEERERANVFYRPEMNLNFQQLPLLRPSCYYIYGARSHFKSAQAEGRQDKLDVTGTATGGSGGVAAGRVKDIVTKGSHSVPFENPSKIAELADQWLQTELDDWRLAEKEAEQAWQSIPVEDRSKVGDEWMHWVNKLWGKKKPASGAPRKVASKL